MGKLKSCSFYFIKNYFKYFFSLFISITILVNGFFIFRVYAEENNFTTIDGGVITEDTTWTKEGSPYIVMNSILIDEGVTLTIDPGVVVKFDPYSRISIDVFGKVIADGTLDEPIYFTSNYDDNVGGNTDEDYEDCYYDIDEWGEPTGEEICEIVDWDEPNVNDWGGLFFQNSVDSEFKNVFFRYARDTISLESSSVNFENLNISDSDSGLIAYNNSHIDIVGGNFSRLNSSGFDIFTNSTLSLDNFILNGSNINVYESSSININKSFIKDMPYGIGVYINSIATINDSSISSLFNGIDVFADSFLNLSGVDIICADICISLYDNVTANILNAKVSGAGDTGIMAFDNNVDTSYINITNSEITENEYGFMVWDTRNFTAHNNSIYNNSIYGALTFPTGDNPIAVDLDFINNWWGDPTGPTYSSNMSGLGDSISDQILFSPWLSYDPLIPRKDPVILIPGITGSYLIKDYGDKEEIWPKILSIIISPFDSFLDDLILNDDGFEISNKPIKVGDIIRNVSILGVKDMHVFDLLINELENNEYIENENLFVFPYDWRLSNKVNSDLLNKKINEILSNGNYGKVDIVGHSMGGLIAKKYIADYGQDKIDQLIFLGTPQLGASKSFKALMFGDDMGYGFNFKENHIGVLNKQTLKKIAQNMPSVYELLPSQKYIEKAGSYVIDAFDKSNIKGLNYQETNNLMIEKGRNPLMYPFAEELHNSIDNLDLSKIDSYNIVGCGTKTIGGITVTKEKTWEKLYLGYKDDFELKYVNGDETVPLASAEATIGAQILYAQGNTHGSLPSADGVRQNVVSILSGEGIKEYLNILEDSSTCIVEGEVVSVHSPAELHIYDEEGNHTGPNADGNIEYGILGVQYDTLEEVKYAFLPKGINYKIITKATNTGGYDFKIEESDKNDNITDIHDWTLIPLKTLETTGEIWIGEDFSKEEYKIKIDEDGDSVIDIEYDEGFNGTSLMEQTTIKHRSSGSYLNPEPYLAVLNEKVEPIKKEVENPIIVQDNKNLNIINNNKKEEIVLQEKEIKQEELDNQEGPQIDNKKNDTLLASTGNFNFKNKNLIWIGTILLGLILGILAKKFKK